MEAMKLPKELQSFLEAHETAEQEMLVFTTKKRPVAALVSLRMVDRESLALPRLSSAGLYACKNFVNDRLSWTATPFRGSREPEAGRADDPSTPSGVADCRRWSPCSALF